MGERLVGRVASFDEPRGLGQLATSDGRTFVFHCAVIADGSRRVDLDATVSFEVVGGHRGQWEAVDIVTT